MFTTVSVFHFSVLTSTWSFREHLPLTSLPNNKLHQRTPTSPMVIWPTLLQVLEQIQEGAFGLRRANGRFRTVSILTDSVSTKGYQFYLTQNCRCWSAPPDDAWQSPATDTDAALAAAVRSNKQCTANAAIPSPTAASANYAKCKTPSPAAASNANAGLQSGHASAKSGSKNDDAWNASSTNKPVARVAVSCKCKFHSHWHSRPRWQSCPSPIRRIRSRGSTDEWPQIKQSKFPTTSSACPCTVFPPAATHGQWEGPSDDGSICHSGDCMSWNKNVRLV